MYLTCCFTQASTLTENQNNHPRTYIKEKMKKKNKKKNYCLKVSFVVSMFKNVGERSKTKTKHPVSFLSVVSKVL